MAGFELGSILSEALNLQGAQTQQAQQQSQLLNSAADLSNQQAMLVSDAGKLSSQAELVNLQGQLQTQQARVQGANAFGTNINDASDIITQLGQQMRSQAISLTQAQAEVSDIEANSDLLTNPAGWLKDLVQGDAARAKRDAIASEFDTTQKLAQSLNSATQSTAQTQNAISETLSAASIQQTAQAKAKLAEADALNLTIQGKKYGADAIGVMREVGAQNFNTSVRAYQLQTDDQRWKEGFALRQAQFEALQQNRKDRADQKAYYTEATNQINEYRARIGLPLVSEQQVTQRLDRGDKIGAEMREQQTSGWKLMERGDAKLFGDTPAQTVARITQDRPDLPESYAPARSILTDAMAAYRQEVEKKINDPLNGQAFKKDAQAQAELYNETVQVYAAQQQQNIQPGKGNPYQALPVETVLAETTNGIAASNFGQKVLQTLVSTGQPDPTPEFLIASTVAALQAGEISFNEARQGIVDFYQSSNAIKNATGGFIQLGVPVATGYNIRATEILGARMPVETDWATPIIGLQREAARLIQQGPPSAEERQLKRQPIVDLTKPADVTTVLTVAASKKRAEAILQQAREKNQ